MSPPTALARLRKAATFWDAAQAALVLGAAYAAKRFYSTASAEDLDFVLAPTTALVELATSARFLPEKHTGYINPDLATLIGPSCAGLNYLVIAASMLGLTLPWRARRPAAKLAWTLTSFGVAYVATVIVNAARITVDIAWRAKDPLTSLSHADAHRIGGIVVYLTSLSLLYLAADRAQTHILQRPTSGDQVAG